MADLHGYEVWLVTPGAPIARSGFLTRLHAQTALDFAQDRVGQLEREGVAAAAVLIEWYGQTAKNAEIHQNRFRLPERTQALLSSHLRKIGLSPSGRRPDASAAPTSKAATKSPRIVRKTIWMIAADGRDVYLAPNGPHETERKLRDAWQFLTDATKKGIAAAFVILHWPPALGEKPSKGNVQRNQSLPTKLERSLAKGLAKYGLDSEGRPLSPADQPIRGRPRPATKRQKEAKPLTVGDVLAKIKRRPDLQPCSTRFARELLVSASPHFYRSCTLGDLEKALARFTRCDWGDVSKAQASKNNRVTRAGKPGEGLFASYESAAGREFWIFGTPTTGKAFAVMPHDLYGWQRFG